MNPWDLPWVVLGTAFVCVFFAAEWERWIECRVDVDCRPTPTSNGTCVHNECVCGGSLHWKCNPDFVYPWTGLDVATSVLFFLTVIALILRCVPTRNKRKSGKSRPTDRQKVAAMFSVLFGLAGLGCAIALIVYSETVDCYTDAAVCPALLSTSLISSFLCVVLLTQI